MTSSRLSRPNQTWAIAYESAFGDPAHPTALELNDRRFVHLVSCFLTEDGTSLVMGDSETDNTMTFCSIGNESTPTDFNVTAQFTWLKDANTGGSGSTVDLTSGFNHATALLDAPDIPYWIISRTGPNNSQDDDFAIGHVIKMAKFTTDYSNDVLEGKTPTRGVQNFVFAGDVNWNHTIAE